MVLLAQGGDRMRKPRVVVVSRNCSMTNLGHEVRLDSLLHRQDESLSDSEYKDYRMNLMNALNAAERKEKLAAAVGAAAFATALVLMFVGGSRIVGDFDPWSKDANPLSVTVGVVWCLASVTWPLALAVGFGRFRPAIGAAKPHYATPRSAVSSGKSASCDGASNRIPLAKPPGVAVPDAACRATRKRWDQTRGASPHSM